MRVLLLYCINYHVGAVIECNVHLVHRHRQLLLLNNERNLSVRMMIVERAAAAVHASRDRGRYIHMLYALQNGKKNLIRNYRQMVAAVCSRIGIAFDSSLLCVLF